VLISRPYENDSQLQFNGCTGKKQGKSLNNHYWEMGMGVLEALRAGFGPSASGFRLQNHNWKWDMEYQLMS
jgi:hypothetical protein